MLQFHKQRAIYMGILRLTRFFFLMKFCFTELRRAMKITENHVYDLSVLAAARPNGLQLYSPPCIK